MRYEVTQSQIAYFTKNKTILFEDFFPITVNDSTHKYTSGFDLWRKHPEIKKIALNRELGTILFQLTDIRPIRLLYDQIVENETVDLTKSPFQGAFIGVLILPTSLIIFTSELPFTVEERSLLIVYGELNSVFTFKEKSPFTARLKKQGYNYGDALSSDDYPLIYR